MTIRRAADSDGHRWPLTGITCSVCRMPSDPANEGRPHMWCEPPAPPLNPAGHAAVLRMIADTLGPVAEVRPLDVWRVSGKPVGAPLPSASIFAAIAAAKTDDALTAVWQQNRPHWTPDHTDAAKRRLLQIGA